MKKRWPRLLALLLFLLVFISLLAYTTVGVRFDVSGQTKTEYQVLSASLTHSVLRAVDGSLVAPKPAAGEGAKACPT